MRRVFAQQPDKTKKQKQQEDVSRVLAMETSQLDKVKKEKKKLLDEISGLKKDHKKQEELLANKEEEVEVVKEEIAGEKGILMSIKVDILEVDLKKETVANELKDQEKQAEKENKKAKDDFSKLKSDIEFEIEDLREDEAILTQNTQKKEYELDEISKKIVSKNKVAKAREQKIIDCDANIVVKNRELKKLDNWIETKNFSNEAYEEKLKVAKGQIKEVEKKKEKADKELKVKDEELVKKNKEFKQIKSEMLGMIKREEKMNKLIPQMKELAKKAKIKIDLE